MKFVNWFLEKGVEQSGHEPVHKHMGADSGPVYFQTIAASNPVINRIITQPAMRGSEIAGKNVGADQRNAERTLHFTKSFNSKDAASVLMEMLDLTCHP